MLPHAKRMQTLNGFQTESMPLSKQLHLWTAKVKWLDLSKTCSKTTKKGSSWTIGVKRAFFAIYFDEPPKIILWIFKVKGQHRGGLLDVFRQWKQMGFWIHTDCGVNGGCIEFSIPRFIYPFSGHKVHGTLGFDRIELCKAKAEAEDMGTRPSCTSPHISSHLLLVILPRSRSESAHGAHICKAFLSFCLKDLERLFHTVPSYYSERILWVCAKLCTRLNLSGLGLSLAVETGRGWDPRRYQASEAARLPMMWCDFPKFRIFPRHFPIGVIPCGLALILQFFQQVFVGSAWSCLGKNWRVRTQPDGFKKNSFATHFHAFVWRSPTNPVTWASLTSMLGRTYRS